MADAQQGVTRFGLQLKPVIPFSFFDPLTELKKGSLNGSYEITGGTAFGMVVRAGITESITFETGINQINRRFDVRIANDTTDYNDAAPLRFIGYEVPVMGLVFIRLGERSYMNNALGFSMDFYPSDAEVIMKESRAYLARNNWLHFGVVGNVGVEYRTRKSGTFYLGATYHRPFGDMAQAELRWFDAINREYLTKAGIGGSYLTVDLRYFLHSDPDRIRKKKRAGE